MFHGRERERERENDVQLHVGSSIDRSGSANRKRAAATRRYPICRERSSLRARQFSVDSQLHSRAASKTHVSLFCMTQWAIERMFIWSQWCACSSGLGAKLRLHQTFRSQNLNFQLQNAKVRILFKSRTSTIVLKQYGRLKSPLAEKSNVHHLFLCTRKTIGRR